MTPEEAPARAKPEKPLIEIDEEEQWRIINESGILNNPALKTGSLSPGQTTAVQEVNEEMTLGDEIFNALLLIIPFSSLLLLFEVYVFYNANTCPMTRAKHYFCSLIRHQYGKRASMEVIMDRMVPGIPSMSIFTFSTPCH